MATLSLIYASLGIWKLHSWTYIVKDLAKTSSSVVEMRRMAGERLLVQQSEAALAQAAVTPHGVTSSSHTECHDSVRAEPPGTGLIYIPSSRSSTITQPAPIPITRHP